MLQEALVNTPSRPVPRFECVQDGEDSSPSATTPDGTGTVANKLLPAGDFRAKYLQKLAHNKVWVPRADRPPRHQTVILFDWDDTLLCTSWLDQHDVDGHLPPSALKVLRESAQVACRMLELATKLGQTFIITNAKAGWVEYSAAKWAPELLPALRQVRIVSAREQYEPMYPDDVNRWKVEAFLQVQRRLDSTAVTNLIVLGDSTFEMNAARIMGRQFEEAFLKTVKFRTRPTPTELQKQVELVFEKLEKIVGNARNMSIFLERRSGS